MPNPPITEVSNAASSPHLKPVTKFPFGYKRVVYLDKHGNPHPVLRKRKADVAGQSSRPTKSFKVNAPLSILSSGTAGQGDDKNQSNINTAGDETEVTTTRSLPYPREVPVEQQDRRRKRIAQESGSKNGSFPVAKTPSSDSNPIADPATRPSGFVAQTFPKVSAKGESEPPYITTRGQYPLSAERSTAAQDYLASNASCQISILKDQEEMSLTIGTTSGQAAERSNIASIQDRNTTKAITIADGSRECTVCNASKENCEKLASGDKTTASGCLTALDPEDDQWEVEKLVNKRGRGKKAKYLVKWLGFGNEDNSWVKKEHIDPSLVEDFEAGRQPQKAVKVSRQPPAGERLDE